MDKTTNYVLIGRDGRQYRQKIDAVLASFEDPGDRAIARKIIKGIQYKIKNGIPTRERLTERTLKSLVATETREKMLINTGLTRTELLRQVGLTPANTGMLLDESNWMGDTFVNPITGVLYSFKFDYNGLLFRRR